MGPAWGGNGQAGGWGGAGGGDFGLGGGFAAIRGSVPRRVLRGARTGESSRRGAVATMTACKDLAGKHPVSALTELCSKRRCVESVWSSQRSARLTAGGCRMMPSHPPRECTPHDKQAMYCLQGWYMSIIGPEARDG